MTDHYPNVMIHESSVIDQPCSIGAGTEIWHFCHVMAHAEIGKKCNLGQNVFVASHVKLGSNVKVQNNVSLYEGVICEDDVFLGPSMVFTNVKTPRSEVSRKKDFCSTLIKRGATIGANATILCNIQIGRYALIGAGAVVTNSVSDYALVVGTPARQIGWSCQCGLRLLETSKQRFHCNSCEKGYAQEEGALILATL